QTRRKRKSSSSIPRCCAVRLSATAVLPRSATAPRSGRPGNEKGAPRNAFVCLLPGVLDLPQGGSVAQRAWNPLHRPPYCGGQPHRRAARGLAEKKRASASPFLQHERPAVPVSQSQGASPRDGGGGAACAPRVERDAGEAPPPRALRPR